MWASTIFTAFVAFGVVDNYRKKQSYSKCVCANFPAIYCCTSICSALYGDSFFCAVEEANPAKPTMMIRLRRTHSNGCCNVCLGRLSNIQHLSLRYRFKSSVCPPWHFAVLSGLLDRCVFSNSTPVTIKLFYLSRCFILEIGRQSPYRAFFRLV